MNLLKNYKERIEGLLILGVLPMAVIGAQILDLCKHC